MVDCADHVGMGGRELVGDGRRSIARAVVDRDDLEGVGQGRQDGERLLDQPGQVGLLVVSREEVRQPRNALAHEAA
jgi:hypothetical protein